LLFAAQQGLTVCLPLPEAHRVEVFSGFLFFEDIFFTLLEVNRWGFSPVAFLPPSELSIPYFFLRLSADLSFADNLCLLSAF